MILNFKTNQFCCRDFKGYSGHLLLALPLEYIRGLARYRMKRGKKGGDFLTFSF